MHDCIAIDWLQLHVNVPIRDFEKTESKYHIEKEKYGTRHFKSIFKIFDRPGGEEIAVLAAEPHHGGWDYRFGLLKLNNKMLYQKNLKQFAQNLLDDLKLEFVNVTRIDIALDFTTFANRLDPKTFIKNYLGQKYMKVGKTTVKTQGKTGNVKTNTKTKKYLVDRFKQVQETELERYEKQMEKIPDETLRVSLIEEFKMHQSLSLKEYSSHLFYNLHYAVDNEEVIKAQFENTSDISFEYLKFGTEKSPLSYTLYNKTKEQEDVKLKPWIQDHWRAWGWQEGTTVWRLEFSFKSSTKEFIEVDPDSGETGSQLGFHSMDILDHAQKIFDYHYKKYFSFVYNEGKSRKDRMKPVRLLTGITTNLVRIDLSEKREATKSDKVFTKKLMELNQELRGHDFELAIFGNELLTYQVGIRGLHTWFAAKFPDVHLSEKQQQHIYEDNQTIVAQEVNIKNIFSVKLRPWESNKSWLYDKTVYRTHNPFLLNKNSNRL